MKKYLIAAWMIIAGVGLWLIYKGFGSTGLIYALILLCPLSHLLMMRGMHSSQSHESHNDIHRNDCKSMKNGGDN